MKGTIGTMFFLCVFEMYLLIFLATIVALMFGWGQAPGHVPHIRFTFETIHPHSNWQPSNLNNSLHQVTTHPPSASISIHRHPSASIIHQLSATWRSGPRELSPRRHSSTSPRPAFRCWRPPGPPGLGTSENPAFGWVFSLIIPRLSNIIPNRQIVQPPVILSSIYIPKLVGGLFKTPLKNVSESQLGWLVHSQLFLEQ